VRNFAFSGTVDGFTSCHVDGWLAGQLDWVEDNLDNRERRSLNFRPAIDLTLTVSLIR
jgi:hypothetical protein